MTNRRQLYEYLGGKCSQCGVSVQEMVDRFGTFNRMFEFHHITPSKKHDNYAALMKKKISAEQIEEIDKCILLCRTCHGIVHAQNNNVSVDLTREICGRKVTQKMEGWYVSDEIEGKFRFMSNERNLLQPCLVMLGSDEPKSFLLLELSYEANMLTWLQKIEEYKKIEITTVDGELLLSITLIEKTLVDVTISLGFFVFSIDFDATDRNTSYLWLRNGMVFTKEGKLYSKGEISSQLNLNTAELKLHVDNNNENNS